jgi:hypothetical protein
MKANILIIGVFTILSMMVLSCQDKETAPMEEIPEAEERVGFELVEIVSFSDIRIWINDEPLSKEEFDSIQITSSWRKNQPREGDVDGGMFYRSPDAEEDGEFTQQEHFGYQWLFNAQIVQQNVPLPENEDGLLNGRYIAKYHQVKFNAGKKLYVLVSPDGEEYVRVSRDANRIIEVPVIPSGWKIEERVISDTLFIDLPNPTLNIRAENNQDSFQGPVTF